MNLKELLTRNPFTIAWLGWIVLFFFIEGMAIWSDVPRATFTHHVRDWLANRETWVRVLGWVFFIWLSTHLLVGLRR